LKRPGWFGVAILLAVAGLAQAQDPRQGAEEIVMSRWYVRSIFPLLVLFFVSPTSRASPDEDPWAAYRFLLGQWVGEGSGQPGKGSGEFSFAIGLQGKVILRTNRAEIAAGNGQAASVHEDLLVIYRGPNGQTLTGYLLR
jgi:hypothetical protein